MKPIEILEQNFLEDSSYLSDQHSFDSYCLFQESMLQKIPLQLVSNLYQIAGKQDTKVISEALSNLTSVTIDTQETSDFFSKVYNSVDLNSIPITTPLKDLHEVELVRPAYLEMFIDDLRKTVEQISSGKISSKETLDASALNPKSIIAYKKKMVRTTIPYDQDYKLLIRTSPKTIPCEVNEVFLMNTVLPFLKNFRDNVKNISLTASKLMKSITDGFQTISEYTKTYNELAGEKMSSERSNLMAYYLFSMGRAFMDLTNYASFMMVRHINNYMSNVNAYMDLYNKIMQYYPEGNSILHESVFDGSFGDVEDADTVFSLLSGDCSIFKSIVRRLLDSHETDLLVKRNSTGDSFDHSLLSTNITDNDYDESPYSLTKEMLVQINKGLDVFEANVKDPYLSMDELKEKSRFNMTFVERFGSQLTRISDLSAYTDQLENYESQFSDQEVLYCIINELEHFEPEMDTITESIRMMYDRIKGLDESISQNINGEFQGVAITGDLHEFMITLEKNYRDFIMLLAQKFLLRLNELDHTAYDITSDSETGDPMISDDDDFLQEAVASCMEDNEMFFREMTNNRKLFYAGERVRQLTGCNPFMEADESGPTVTSSDADKSGSNDQKPASTPEQGKPASTDQNVQTNDQNKDQNNDQGNTEAGGKKKFDFDEMMKKLAEFFQNIIQKFTTLLDKQSGKNLKWLNANKELLESRVLRGTQVSNFYKYDQNCVKNLGNHMTSVISSINQLNEGLGKMSDADIDKALFGFINIQADLPIREKMVQWFTTGTAPMEKVTIANKEVQNQIPVMIDFCLQYYDESNNGLGKMITKYTGDIQKAWENKAKSLRDKVEPNRLMYVTKQIKYFCGTVMNTMRNRNYAYLKVLKSLVPKDANKKEEPKTEENNQNTETNENKEEGQENKES